MTNESPRFNKHSFSVDKAQMLISTINNAGGLFIAIKESEIIGFFAGVVIEHFLSHDTYATDIGVYITPNHRGGTAFLRLVKAFEDWATQMGATEIQLGVSTGIHPQSTVRMYERLGYTMTSYGLMKARV